MGKVNIKTGKIKSNQNIFTLKVKTESNGLGVLKTLLVMVLIFLQLALIISSYYFFLKIFHWYFAVSLILTGITCIYVLSSDIHGQAKAMWVLFLLLCFSFGYVIYFLSDKKILFRKARLKYANIEQQHKQNGGQLNISRITNQEEKTVAQYLYNVGNFIPSLNSRVNYLSSGNKVFDSVIEELQKATQFIFIEYFILSNGVLFNRIFDILKQKARQGIDIRIIYDDMGSHNTLKRRTKKEIRNAGIKLECFNRLVPVFNIALNLRDHRKIIVIDGKVAYTGGVNLSDEYINEKRMHGYWKDCGVKIEGEAVDNLTVSFLKQWEFLTQRVECFKKFTNKADRFVENGVVIPFVSGPNYSCSIAKDIYASLISSANKILYIMSPYFIPDETITNLLIQKARSGVDVRLILPDVADKKFVYIVSRNNAEKLLTHGIKVYTMKSCFVHSKVVLTENSAVVGSINMDLRSFFQQFESAVYVTQENVLSSIKNDFGYVFDRSLEITLTNQKRNNPLFRVLAGLFNLVSPCM